MAIVFVRGNTRRISSKAAGKSLATATTVSFSVSLSYWTRRCSTAVNIIGVFGKSSRAMPLHKVRGRRADSDDQVGWLFAYRASKIINKWGVRFFIIHRSTQKRVVLKSTGAFDCPAYFRPKSRA